MVSGIPGRNHYRTKRAPIPGRGRLICPQLLNDQSVLNATELEIECPSGGVVSIDWGDGSTSAVTCDGSLQTLTHTYTATGQYVIRVLGTVGQITDFRCYGQSWISGDLANITAGMSSMRYLRLYNTGVTGDISALSSMTSMEALYLYNTGVSDYTSTALPAWGGAEIEIYDLGLSQSEVDDFLVDLDDGDGPDGDLDISGTNAAPSATGLAAKTNLEANGWTVTVTT